MSFLPSLNFFLFLTDSRTDHRSLLRTGQLINRDEKTVDLLTIEAGPRGPLFRERSLVMQKFMMSAVLGLAFLAGSTNSQAGAPSAAQPTIAARDEVNSSVARLQDFGPWSHAVARAKCNQWTAAGYKCWLVKSAAGRDRWFVRVQFQN